MPELRELWERSVQRDRPAEAVPVLFALEQTEPFEPRWSQRLGEALRRVGRTREAELAFVRATERYVEQGFLPRAVAMAKLVTAMNPERRDLLARLEHTSTPAPARGRAVPPPLPHARPQTLQRAQDSAVDEVRFEDSDPSDGLDLELTMAEFARDGLGAASPPAAAPAEPPIDRMGAMTTFRLFAGLPREALVALADAADLVEHARGELLMKRNAHAGALYLLIEGAVRVHLPDGREVRLSEGDIVGEGCLLDEGQRQADVRTESPVMALRIEKHKLDAVTEQHPAIGQALFQLLARRLVTNLMHTSPLFAAFEPKVRVDFAQLFEIRRAELGTVICARGKRSDGLYILLSGVVTSTSDMTAMRVARGTAFGHGSLLGAAPAPITVTAASEAVLLRLPAGKFAQLVALFPPALALLAETDDDTVRAR